MRTVGASSANGQEAPTKGAARPSSQPSSQPSARQSGRPGSSGSKSAARRVHVVVNMRSGAVLERSTSEVRRTILQMLSHPEREIAVECVEPADVRGAMVAAIEAQADELIVGGGDGTIRTAGELLAGSDIALGIIPLGTLNRLARDLKIPLELEAALAALDASETVRIDVASVNNQVFLCNSLMGLPIKVAEGRQHLRGGTVWMWASGHIAIVADVIRTTHRLSLSMHDGNKPRKVRAISIAVSNNAYEASPSFMMFRPSIDRGELALYLASHSDGGRLLISIFRAMLGLWRRDPEIEEIRVSTITLDTVVPRHIKLSNDGEVARFSTPLKYAIQPGALRVLRPKNPAL